MKLSISKTIEDFIEVETPSFWMDKSQNYSMIKEDEIILVSNIQITIIGKSDICGTWYSETVKKAIGHERVTEVLFLEKLFEVQDLINTKAGVSPIPTIFTQNKFKVIQKAVVAVLFFLCFSFSSFAQDTIHCHRVKISESVGVNRKTGRILYASPKWVTVTAGFIAKESTGMYLINGKEYKPGNHKTLKIR